MTSNETRHERRGGQRFGFQMAIGVCRSNGGAQGSGFTQDLSARGASFFTDMTFDEGEAVELTLIMPSEITLAESMRVRCRGRVVRVFPTVVSGKFGVAVQLHGYEFLPEIEFASTLGASPGSLAISSQGHA